MMSNPALQPTAGITADERRCLEEAIERLEASWQRGHADALSRYLPPVHGPLRQRILTELIKVDQEYRWRRGERRFLEDYLRQWPELETDVETCRELLEAECVTRLGFGSAPTHSELERRFPDLAEQLNLERIEAVVAEENESITTAEPGEAGPDVTGEEVSFGRYRIRERIDRGGMGEVFRAYDPQLDRTIALKVPRVDPAAEPDVVERFVAEARAMARVVHPHVCPVFDAGEHEGLPYLTMRLVEGQSLPDWRAGRPVTVRQAVEIIEKLARALAAIHEKRLVHRDVKATNVMMTAVGEPMLMDFGLARRTDETDAAGVALCSGTPAYMAPEQISRDGGSIDARTDIYSLGVVFYQLLTGELPYGGTLTELQNQISNSEPVSPGRLNPEVDQRLAEICLRAMAKRPEDRFQSAAAMADALQGHLQSPNQPASSRRRTRRVLAVGAVLGAVASLWALSALLTGPPLEKKRSAPPVGSTAQARQPSIITPTGADPDEARQTVADERSLELAAIAVEMEAGLPGDPDHPRIVETRQRLLDILRAYDGGPGEGDCIEAARLLARLPWPTAPQDTAGNEWWDMTGGWPSSRKMREPLPNWVNPDPPLQVRPGCSVVVRGEAYDPLARVPKLIRVWSAERGTVVAQVFPLTLGYLVFVKEKWRERELNPASNTSSCELRGFVHDIRSITMPPPDNFVEFSVRSDVGAGSLPQGEYLLHVWLPKAAEDE